MAQWLEVNCLVTVMEELWHKRGWDRMFWLGLFTGILIASLLAVARYNG